MVETLLVEQYRVFKSRTTLDFNPALTIIVGENGAGKTSVLWALRVLLSHTLRKITKERPTALSFSSDDAAKGWPFLRAEASMRILGRTPQRVKCTVQKNVSAFIKSTESDGRPREHAVDTLDKYMVDVELLPSQGVPYKTSHPLAVYYSAHRSLALDRGTRKTLAVVGPRAAYAQALDDRGLHLGQAAFLWRKESVLETSDGLPARANRAIERALPNFLGDFKNIRIDGEDQPRLVVEKRGTTLNLNQLSDGERGLLAVLMDLTRRLALVTQELEYLVSVGKCRCSNQMKLIRTCIRDCSEELASLLEETFPKLQFIADYGLTEIISEMESRKTFFAPGGR